MARTTLTIRKPRINLAHLRKDLTSVVRATADMNFGSSDARNQYIAQSLIERGHEAPRFAFPAELARLVGLKVVDGVIYA